MAKKRGGEEWETPAHSDEVFTVTVEDDSDPSSQLLEVPALTTDVLDAMEAQANGSTPLPPQQPSAPVQHGEPGSVVPCEICDKQVRVKRDGTLSQHRCEPKSQRGNRFDHLPAPKPAPRKVRDFCINVVAWSVEEGSAQLLARAAGVDAQDVPTELPDAEEMIGPPLDIIWPHIPESVQDVLTAVADNSQLISCALLWMEWGKNLSTWTREMRAYQQSLTPQGDGHLAAPQSQPANQYGTLHPFRPAQPQ